MWREARLTWSAVAGFLCCLTLIGLRKAWKVIKSGLTWAVVGVLLVIEILIKIRKRRKGKCH